MTLYNLTTNQKDFLTKKLFNYEALKKLNELPTHIMYFADKHIGMAGILFLKKNLQGVEYDITSYGLQGKLLPVDTTNKMIAYIESKTFQLLPNTVYQSIKDMIIQQEQQ